MSYAVIFVGAILGAITGTVAASVIAMGVISMVPMLKYGYSTRHTMGVIAASGTITQLIPPSLVLVVLADVLGRSVGDMYAGAIGPSIIQVALFCVWVAIVSIIWPKSVPALPIEARTLNGWALWKKCLRGMIPSLGLIFLVLGTIFMGLAIPTEAGAMGVVGAIALAASYGTLTWKLLYQGMASTMRLTAMVVYILIGARVFSLVFQGSVASCGSRSCSPPFPAVSWAFSSSPTLSSSWWRSSSISSRSLSSSFRCWPPSPTSSGSISFGLAC